MINGKAFCVVLWESELAIHFWRVKSDLALDHLKKKSLMFKWVRKEDGWVVTRINTFPFSLFILCFCISRNLQILWHEQNLWWSIEVFFGVKWLQAVSTVCCCSCYQGRTPTSYTHSQTFKALKFYFYKVLVEDNGLHRKQVSFMVCMLINNFYVYQIPLKILTNKIIS